MAEQKKEEMKLCRWRKHAVKFPDGWTYGKALCDRCCDINRKKQEEKENLIVQQANIQPKQEEKVVEPIKEESKKEPLKEAKIFAKTENDEIVKPMQRRTIVDEPIQPNENEPEPPKNNRAFAPATITAESPNYDDLNTNDFIEEEIVKPDLKRETTYSVHSPTPRTLPFLGAIVTGMIYNEPHSAPPITNHVRVFNVRDY